MRKISLVAALTVAMAGTAHARMTTGKDLMQHCIAAPDKFCGGYIGGVIDTSHALFCFPSEVSKRKIINITIMYLRDHPEKQEMYAPNLVIRAIRDAFPCRDGR